MSTTWIEAAKQKLASSAPPQDDKAITEAFAQQAYTAVGNRDRDIMRDPYLLGFEIVTKNEENTRLVGAFAFRVSGEILLVPVFYLNGQIKGQDLLYRKGVNRFCPNTEKWIAYLVSRGEDSEGRGVQRQGPDARINLNLSQIAGSNLGFKQAAAARPEPILPTTIPDGYDGMPGQIPLDDATGATQTNPNIFSEWLRAQPQFRKWTVVESGKAIGGAPSGHTLPPVKQAAVDALVKQACVYVDSPEGLPVGQGPITALFKEAMEAWHMTEPEHLFADLIIEQGMQKQAADLVARYPEFGEMIELGQLLKHASAKADAPEPSKEASLILHREPADGWTEPQLEAYYKQGFVLEDKRNKVNLATAFTESPMSESVITVSQPGIQNVTDGDGTKVRALWAPQIEDNGCYPTPIGSERGDTYETPYILVLLEGKDKGCALRYSQHSGRGQMPVFEGDAEVNPDEKEVKGEKPKAGGTYVLWFPKEQKVWGDPFVVRSVTKSGELTKINFDDTAGNCGTAEKIVIRADIEESDISDFGPDNNMPRVCGKDVVWVPVKAELNYDNNGPQTPANISWARLTPPSIFRPLTADRMESALLKTKTASIEIIPDNRGKSFDIRCNGRTRCRDLSYLELVCKMARDLHLHVDEATEWADNARNHQPAKFSVISPAQQQKLAAAYGAQPAVSVPASQPFESTESPTEEPPVLQPPASSPDSSELVKDSGVLTTLFPKQP